MHCKKCGRTHNEHHGGGFMQGAMWGALFGAVLGMMYAPEKGDETRKKLKKVRDEYEVKGKEVADKARLIAEEVHDVAKPLITEIEEKVRPLIEKAMESGGDVQFEVMEKIEQIIASESKNSRKKK